MPTRWRVPLASTWPTTPRTAPSSSRATVVAGAFRSIEPSAIPAFTAAGSASASTLRPTASAVAGLTPVRMTSCMRSVSVQKVSSPKVSKRKIDLPSANVGGLWPPFAARTSSDEGATGRTAASRVQAASATARTSASVEERMTHLCGHSGWRSRRSSGNLPTGRLIVKHFLDILHGPFQPCSLDACIRRETDPDRLVDVARPRPIPTR